MAKVDADKFIALLVELYCRRQCINRKMVQTYIDEVLEQMGFKVENGEIVKIESPKFTPYDHLLDRPITDHPLSVRSLNCLKSAGINTLRQLVRHHEADLLTLRNFGKRSIAELTTYINAHGLTWGMKV